MFGTDRDDRTEPASPRRLEEARRCGLVPRSRDLTAAVVLLASAACLSQFGPTLTKAGGDLLRDALAAAPRSPAALRDGEPLRRSVATTAEAASGALGLLALAAAAANVLQFGFRLTPDAVRPAWNRVGVSGGWRRMAASAHPARAGFTLLKLLLVALITVWSVVDAWPLLSGLSNLPAAQLAAAWGSVAIRLAWQLAAVLLVLAVGDLLYQRRRHALSLRMTREEARDEARQQERDPARGRRPLDAVRPLSDPQSSTTL